MEIAIFYVLFTTLFICVLWAGTRILQKAGFDPRLVLCLLVPVLNILMVWVFAFSKWPNIKAEID
jgi:hypothetical protein